MELKEDLSGSDIAKALMSAEADTSKGLAEKKKKVVKAEKPTAAKAPSVKRTNKNQKQFLIKLLKKTLQ